MITGHFKFDEVRAEQMKQMVTSPGKTAQRRRSRSRSDIRNKDKSNEMKTDEDGVKIKTEDLLKEGDIKVEPDTNGRLSKDRSRASSKHDSRSGREVIYFFVFVVI